MAAPTVPASGTQTAILTTEHTLTTQTVGGVYVLQVLTNNMAVGDQVILKINLRTVVAGTWYLAYQAIFIDVQREPIKLSIPVPVDVAIQCTLTQVSGTGRGYDWKLFLL